MAGEMAQRFETLAALAEDSGYVPITHIAGSKPSINTVPEDLTLSSDLPRTRCTSVHTQANTHTHYKITKELIITNTRFLKLCAVCIYACYMHI